MNLKQLAGNSVILCVGILLFRFLIEPIFNLGNTAYLQGVKSSIQDTLDLQSILILLGVSIAGGVYITWRQARKRQN